MAKYNINSNIMVNEIGLEGGDNDRLVLRQIIIQDGSKTYIKDILIRYDDKVIVRNYRDSIPFLITLKSFVKRNFIQGDENRYFQYVEQSIDKKKKNSNTSNNSSSSNNSNNSNNSSSSSNNSSSNSSSNKNHKIRRSLNCKFDKKKYISFNEAFIIIAFIESSKQGHSPIKLDIGKTILDINEIRFTLDDNKIYTPDRLSDTLDDRFKELGIDAKNMSDDDKLSLYIERI